MTALFSGRIFNRKPDSVTIFSGVFLHRSLAGIPFPGRASRVWLDDIRERVCTVYREELRRRGYRYLDLDGEVPDWVDARFPTGLFADHRSESGQGRALIYRSNRGFVINDQDHFRIFCMSPGLRLEECSQGSFSVDAVLESRFDYAFHRTWGYLTADPRDCGTGMRAEIRIHLPALAFLYGEEALIQLFQDKGYFIEQNSGGDCRARGHVFHITNRYTLGVTERSITDSLRCLAAGLVKWERQVRINLIRSLDRRRQLEENVLNEYKRIYELDDYTQRELFNLFSLWVLGWQEGIFARRRGLNIQEVKNLVQHIVTRNRTLGKECAKLLNFFGVISGEEFCNV